MGKREKFQITNLAACLVFFLTWLLRGQETKEFKLIQLEKLINTFTDLEVRNNPLKRNGVNLEILTTKKRTRGDRNSQQLQ